MNAIPQKTFMRAAHTAARMNVFCGMAKNHIFTKV
jgi:hypothetical protein